MQVKEVNDEWREKRVGLDTCAGGRKRVGLDTCAGGRK